MSDMMRDLFLQFVPRVGLKMLYEERAESGEKWVVLGNVSNVLPQRCMMRRHGQGVSLIHPSLLLQHYYHYYQPT